jgi:lysyl-tRNA synthetase class 2
MDNAKDLLSKRKEKANGLKADGINLFPNGLAVEHTIRDIGDHIERLSDEQQEDPTRFTVAGRMMAINRFGKSAFIRFRDRTGMVQAYVRKDKVGTTGYDLFKRLDVGDFVRISGSLFRTKTGEWTILATTIELVCKSTRPLPEKFHGLKDPEKRYRQRYIDLIMNPDVQDIFIKRSRIIQAMRTFFLSRDFLEVETPMMQPIPGGAEATPFKTHHNALGMDLYLRIAPELYLKRLVVGGFERVFEINRNFRNEGVSTQHNPEFTMVEFYQAYATYEDLMDLTEQMVAQIAESVTGSTRDLSGPGN